MQFGKAPAHVAGLLSREHWLSLLDQGVVSGSSFLSTLLIANSTNSVELGFYALGLSVLISVVGFQEALILQPYTIHRLHSGISPTEHAGASLILSLLFSAVNIFVLVTAALVLDQLAGAETAAVTWVLAAAIPFALTRDFARRFDFAHLETTRVLFLDSAVAVVQLAALGLLAANGRMSAVNACGGLGIACALPTAFWLHQRHRSFAIHRAQLLRTLQQTWRVGKWLLASRITGQMQMYAAYWITAALGSAAVTGVYAACMSIIGIGNPLLIGLMNVYMPKSVLAYRQGGGPLLSRDTIRNTVLMGGLMALFSLAVLFAGEPLMHFLYPEKDFVTGGYTIIVLALATALGALGAPPAIALAAMERSGVIIIVTALEALITLALVSLLMMQWGLLGAAFGMFWGNLSGTVGHWVAFWLLVPKSINLMTRPLAGATPSTPNIAA
jgi:O-antigen/teichoic acid export membrane protein